MGGLGVMPHAMSAINNNNSFTEIFLSWAVSLTSLPCPRNSVISSLRWFRCFSQFVFVRAVSHIIIDWFLFLLHFLFRRCLVVAVRPFSPDHSLCFYWHLFEFQIITVELNRGWNSRLGFSLQTNPNTKQTYVSAIYTNSVAAKDGRLRVDDQILMVSPTEA